ncbi:major facilitator superfamily-domain-containing protein [Radiomyces spectabilis]|uniref:major facilitator superfamily-domain-containing protein n=1 Tax=Radiomyces spectabilis TaxID=64574 RepID=UPI0022202E66|nr:major facilitator superfamily-domain-containing protein [Radiomyces spectabilis]KAI8364749.1 major facilitator superfamily-domain-containing protein [Radiomyces spectabilis]
MAGWAGTLYLLLMTSFQPLFGSLAERLGRKIVIMVALTTFILGGVCCSVSVNMWMFIVSRAWQAVGSGGILSLTYVMVADLVPPEKRGKYQFVLSISWGSAAILGPLMCGTLVDDGIWQYTFYINVILAMIALLLLAFFFPWPNRPCSVWIQMGRMDYTGMLLMLSSTIVLLLALQWGGYVYPWASPLILTMIAIGIVLLVLFICHEVYRAAEPMISFRMFQQRTVRTMFLGHFLFGLATYGMHFYMPTYFQVINGDSAAISGLEMLPDQLSGPICYGLVSVIIARTGTIRIFVWIGFGLLTIGAALITCFDIHTSLLQQLATLLLTGISTGLIVEPSVIITQHFVMEENVAVATSLCNFFRSLGGSFSIAIYSTVFLHTLNTGLMSSQLSSDEAERVKHDLLLIAGLTEPLKSDIQSIYARSVRQACILMIPFALVGLFSVLWAQPVNVRRPSSAASPTPESLDWESHSDRTLVPEKETNHDTNLSIIESHLLHM